METITHTHITPAFAYPGADDATTTHTPKGGKTRRKNPLYKTSPLFPAPSPSTLTAQTMAALRTFFAERNHVPSQEMWTALGAAADTMEAMAEGRCSPAIYLSSLDPGVGKTTTVICFLRALLTSDAHRDVAALVCVKRKDQIEAIVQEANLDCPDFAVLTSDQQLNAIGCGEPDQARVLFTTHAMIEKRCEGRQFTKLKCFQYQDEPRAVRIWDEAILPGQTLTVSRDSLGHLFDPLRGRYPALINDVEELFTGLKNVENGSTICLPDLAEVHGADLNQVLEVVADRPEQKLTVEALWFLFGKYVTVRRDGTHGNTMLDYKDTLPDDLKPLLTLDASVRVRYAYRCWEKGRGGISRLPWARKRYDNLDIYVWNRGGGKGGFRRDGMLFVEGIVTTVMTRPDEEWLIIQHKPDIDMDLEQEVRARLPLFGPQVHFCHWGVHDATNQFANVPNVILAGTLFMRTSYYEALGRLASAYPSCRGRFDPKEITKVTLGEHRHMILQALCRGAARKCDGNGCPPARAYIIASQRSGITQELSGDLPLRQRPPMAARKEGPERESSGSRRVHHSGAAAKAVRSHLVSRGHETHRLEQQQRLQAAHPPASRLHRRPCSRGHRRSWARQASHRLRAGCKLTK